MLTQKLYESGPSFAESFNFGPRENDTKNVEWIAEHFIKLWGSSLQYENAFNSSQPHEAHFLKLNSEKARTKLAWQPLCNVEEALQKICNWHQAYLNNENMNTFSLDEIKRNHLN